MPRPIHRWLFLYCILIFVLKDCQSLFLRHNQTGKCIAASEELAVNSKATMPYYVKMTDNCLEKTVEFRYLDSQLLHNIEKGGTLLSSSAPVYHSRWVVYKGVKETQKRYQRNARHSLKQTTEGSLFFYEGDKSVPKFWPTVRGKPSQYDLLTVQLESEKESDGIWTRKFILSPYPDLSDGQVVNIFHHTKWPDHRAPPDAAGVITLTSLVENSRKNHGHGPIIVACSDGAGRTGTYIAISNLLERMKIEQTMDVFQSIKIIRGTRPQFVENAEQYQFCYTAIMAYLDAFSEYANFE